MSLPGGYDGYNFFPSSALDELLCQKLQHAPCCLGTVLPALLLFHRNTICHLLGDTSLLTSQKQISKMPNLKQQYFKTCVT